MAISSLVINAFVCSVISCLQVSGRGYLIASLLIGFLRTLSTTCKPIFRFHASNDLILEYVKSLKMNTGVL